MVTLRDNLTPATEAGRHALRLAAVAGLAEVLVQATGLPSGRWVVLTIFLVLKPDYASTLLRGVHRAVGTALGAILGVVAAQLGQLGQGGLVVAAGASIAAAWIWSGCALCKGRRVVPAATPRRPRCGCPTSLRILR